MGVIYYLGEGSFDGAISLGSFRIKYHEINITLDFFDAILFTSKNAINPLLKYKETLTTKEIYSIGSKTTQALNINGLQVKYESPKQTGDEFANELIVKLRGKKVLYPKPNEVVSSLITILRENNINLTTIDVYETVCNKTQTKLEPNSIIIFSSPSSIKCFLQSYNWQDDFKAITIGKTTSKHMPKNINFIQSQNPSVDECIALAKTLM